MSASSFSLLRNGSRFMSTTDGQTARRQTWSWATSTSSASTARTCAARAMRRARAKTQLKSPRQVCEYVCYFQGVLHMLTPIVSCVTLFSLCFAPHLFTGLVLKDNQYKEKDMSCVPKFTQPLVDRSVVAGYSTAISCAVKGFPRVSTCTYLEDSVENNSAAKDASRRKQIPDNFSISKHKGQDVSLMFGR